MNLNVKEYFLQAAYNLQNQGISANDSFLLGRVRSLFWDMQIPDWTS